MFKRVIKIYLSKRKLQNLKKSHDWVVNHLKHHKLWNKREKAYCDGYEDALKDIEEIINK